MHFTNKKREEVDSRYLFVNYFCSLSHFPKITVEHGLSDISRSNAPTNRLVLTECQHHQRQRAAAQATEAGAEGTAAGAEAETDVQKQQRRSSALSRLGCSAAPELRNHSTDFTIAVRHFIYLCDAVISSAIDVTRRKPGYAHVACRTGHVARAARHGETARDNAGHCETARRGDVHKPESAVLREESRCLSYTEPLVSISSIGWECPVPTFELKGRVLA